MSKHALTRVTFKGDKTIVVAGAISPTIAVKGLTQELLEAAPVARPGAKSNIPKPPVPPARVPKAAVAALNAKTQAEPPEAAKETK